MNNSSRINAKSSIHRHHDDWDEVHNQMLEVQQKGVVQKKSLSVSDPGDADEKEADEVARKVVNNEKTDIGKTEEVINRKVEGASVIQRQVDPLTEVKAVKSVIVPLAEGGVKQQWIQVKNRFKERTKGITDGNGIKEWRKGNEEPLDRLLGTTRWASLKKSIDDTKENGTTVTIPADNFGSLIEAERADANLLKGQLAGNTKSAILTFLGALEKLVTLRGTLDTKTKTFHQHDKLFVNTDVLKILAKIKPPIFTPADLKAQMSIESGDFEKQGNDTYMGIGAIGSEGKTIGIDWAKANAGVTIPENVMKDKKSIDSRLDAQSAIMMTAGILGHYLAFVTGKLGTRMPSQNVEKKKLVWAAYNTKINTYTNALTAAMKSVPVKDPVTFDKMILPSETTKYIPAILARL